MTESKSVPAPVAPWVESVPGPVEVVRDTSRARPNSHVWEVASHRASRHFMAEEETGVRITPLQQEFCGLVHHHAPGGLDRITAVIMARSWTGEPHHCEPKKHEGLFRVSTEKPPPDCHPYSSAILEMLTRGPSYRALNRPMLVGAL